MNDAHLAIAPDCPDPRAELTKLVERLTSDMPTAAKPKLRGKVLTMSNSLRHTAHGKHHPGTARADGNLKRAEQRKGENSRIPCVYCGKHEVFTFTVSP